MTHSLIRTNPKGQPGIGKCIKCGLENIPLSRMREDCPNAANITDGEALLIVMDDQALAASHD